MRKDVRAGERGVQELGGLRPQLSVFRVQVSGRTQGNKEPPTVDGGWIVLPNETVTIYVEGSGNHVCDQDSVDQDSWTLMHLYQTPSRQV